MVVSTMLYIIAKLITKYSYLPMPVEDYAIWAEPYDSKQAALVADISWIQGLFWYAGQKSMMIIHTIHHGNNNTLSLYA